MSKTAAQWALVTGVSSGLGVDFARWLAARGFNLVLNARRKPEMQALADELCARHGIEMTVDACDLAEPDSARDLQIRLDERDIAPDVPVNNAALGITALCRP